MTYFSLSTVATSVTAACLALAGCGGGDGGGPVAAGAGSISGSIVKGPVNAATVCAYKIDAAATGKKGALVAATNAGAINGCVVTAADGSYSLALPAGTTGDLIVEAGGGSYCSNEALYDAAAKTCAGTGGSPIALSVTKLTSVVEAPAAGVVASSVVTPLSTSAFANMVAAGLGSMVAFRSQFTALVTTSGLPSSLSAATLANDPTLQAVLASFQRIAGNDPTVLSTFLTALATGGYRYGTGGFTLAPAVTTPPTATATATATTTTPSTTTTQATPTTPTTPITTPPSTPIPGNASSGILGVPLATVFAGNYGLNCRAATDFYSSGPVTSFLFRINTDGTSALNGNPWIDSNNTGTIELTYLPIAGQATATGSPQSPFTLSFNKTNGGFNNVSIGLKPDGSLSQASVTNNSTQYNCSTLMPNLTQTVPATLSNVSSPAFNSSIGQKLARTEIVSGCSVGGTPTLALGMDGSAMLGSVSFAGNQIASVMDKTFDVPAFNGKRYSYVQWVPGTSSPYQADASTLIYGFDGSFATYSVVATKPNFTTLVLCSK